MTISNKTSQQPMVFSNLNLLGGNMKTKLVAPANHIGTVSKQEVEYSLSAIMGALAANPNCSQDELFQCCTNAFEIAEAALLKLQNGK